MIELLNERKQIIINNAVTKGLDPNVNMKDSGVDWIGEIPEGWEVKKLKHVTSKIGSGSTPRGGADVYTDYGVRFLRSQNVYNDGLRLSDVAYISDNVHVKMKGTQVRENDILYNITGGSIGRCCCYTDDKEANVNQHVSIVRPFGIVPKFLMFSLQSSNAQRQLRITLKGGNREGLAAESFKEFLIVVPTLNDQKKIVADIESKFVTINNAIDVTNNQITLLQERKQIIINEVVTGKVKVS
jgi:type I restriction enzyme S subunit